MSKFSLKTRMALVAALFFLCFGMVAGVFAIAYFQQKFKETIVTQQTSLVSSLAADLDKDLLFAQRALAVFAPKLTPEVLGNQDRLQLILDDKTTLLLIFDGIGLLSPEGKAITGTPLRPVLRGGDFSHRDYFKKTVATAKPQISAPFRSISRPDRPSIMLTQPVFDARGKITAILVGSIDLLGENFLTDIGRLPIGKSGYAALCAGNRTLIMHPDRSRIMESIPAGQNLLLDKAFAGFEGSGETVTTKGVTVLSSFKRLRAVDWLLIISYPLNEAYLPLYRARTYFVSAMVLGLFLMLVMSWYAMQRLMSPLSRLTRHIETLNPDADGREMLPVESDDEIGTLATAFNTMMSTIHEKGKSLRAAVQQANEERAKADAIIAALGDGLSIQSREFRVLYQNEEHQRLTGGNHVGRFCYEAYRGGAQVCEACPVARCIADGQLHTLEYRNPPGNVAEYLEISVSPLRDAGGEIVAVVELVRDVTARKRAEAQVQKLNAELEQRVRERTEELQHSVREMETFCYTVSHDLRTPLRGIHGFSSILQQEYGHCLDESGREYLRRIAGAAGRMGELIDDLLELSRVTRDELRWMQVDLAALASEIAGELSLAHPERAAEFIIEPGLVAPGDPSLLQAVIANLLYNAWKFSARTPAARIEVGSRVEDGERLYFVRDNGIGFDMQFADKLFLPFHRLHAAEGFEGTGIGLAAVQRIVERHGGRIWAESSPGQGATFFFTLGVCRT